MYIETERLIITEFNMEMAEDVHKNSLDEDCKKFIPDEVFETVEDASETLEFLIEQYYGGKGPFVYPVLLKDNTNIGYVQLVAIKDGWEIGYHIAKQYTNQGYATEAVTAFLPIIANERNITEIFGICRGDNFASASVMNKCGFENLYKGMGRYKGKEVEIIKNVWKVKE